MAYVQRNLKGGKAYVMVGNLQVFPDGRRDVRAALLSCDDLEVSEKSGGSGCERGTVEKTQKISEKPDKKVVFKCMYSARPKGKSERS